MIVVIAEDSSSMRTAIAGVVRGLGLDVLETPNGAEALQRLEESKNEVALVILDWNMPVMDGFEALSQIRGNSAYDDIPVLMATSAGMAQDAKKALDAGANSYLVKPFKKEDLRSLISLMIPSATAQA